MLVFNRQLYLTTSFALQLVDKQAVPHDANEDLKLAVMTCSHNVTRCQRWAQGG